MKNSIILFSAVLMVSLWMWTFTSLANSPGPAPCISISPEHVPEDARFLDVLIPMSPDDPYYCAFNQDTGSRTGLSETAPIVVYCDGEGYISYSFHMEHALSQMELKASDSDETYFYAIQFGNGAYAGNLTHLEYIQKHFGTIRAALLDENGAVLSVSHEASIRPGRFGYLTGVIQYDCETGQLSPHIYKGNVLGIIIMVIFFFVFILSSLTGLALFTSVVETGVSMAFHIRPWSTVFLVNLISNMVFNLALMVNKIFGLIPYLVFVTVGEVVVVKAEYSVYLRLLPAYSRKRLLWFTLTANLASLLLGIGCNYLLT